MSVRIALVIGELETGGTQRQILELAKGLDRRIFTPYVCVLSNSLAFAPAFEAAGIPLHVMPKKSRYDALSIARLRSFFKTQDVMAVITFGFTADSWARVAAKTARVPVVISSVRTSNEDLGFVHRVNRILAPWTSHFIGNSFAVKDYLRNVVGVADSRISIIPNGLDFTRFNGSEKRAAVRQRIGLSPGDFVVGIVSRLSPEKNVQAFVRVAASVSKSVPNARFVVVGDGPERANIRRLIGELGVEGVITLLGERSDVPSILQALDVAMLTSRREGLSNSLLEYMATGLPIVASAVGGNPEVLANGETGLLYQVDDLEAATQQVLRLYSNSDLRQSLSASARKAAGERYSTAAMVTATQDLVLRLLPEAAKSRILSENKTTTQRAGN